MAFIKPFVKGWLGQKCVYKKLGHNKKTPTMATNQKALDLGGGSKNRKTITTTRKQEEP